MSRHLLLSFDLVTAAQADVDDGQATLSTAVFDMTQ